MPILTYERDIERKACKAILAELGVYGSKLVAPGQTGFPDRIFWVPGGRPLLAEFKRPGGKLSAKQVYIIEILGQLGYNVGVYYDQHSIIEAVTRAVEAARLSE